MSNINLDETFFELAIDELTTITGGAGPSQGEFDAVRQKAAQYCPQTAQHYSSVDPATLTRGKAVEMGNACLAEMGSFKASFARGQINDAIDKQFPRK
jgi:hypothetical protein